MIEEGPFLMESVPAQLVIHEAPKRTKMSLAELAYALRQDHISIWEDKIMIGTPRQFLYQVVGWEEGKPVLCLTFNP